MVSFMPRIRCTLLDGPGRKNFLMFLFIFMTCFLMINKSSTDGTFLNKDELDTSQELDGSEPDQFEDGNIPGDSANSILKVLVLGYQRCGSSLLGSIFNMNPDAFFVFEPLDGSYIHMYSTGDGWNVPSDIFYYRNGSRRTLPDAEVKSVSNTVLGFLRCDTNLIPTETLTHTFLPQWRKRQVKLLRYTTCVSKHKAWSKNCRIKHLCPVRFGRRLDVGEICYNVLDILRSAEIHNQTKDLNNYIKKSQSVVRKHSQQDILRGFQGHVDCIKKVRDRAEYCFPVLNLECTQSAIRSVKTVRMTMVSVKELLKHEPDVKVLHLFRDPRAVAWSRLRQPSFRGIWSKEDIVREAALYCDQAIRDVKLSCELSQNYPKTFHKVIYEDFSKNLTQGAYVIYQFLGRKIPEKLQEFLAENTRPEVQYPSWTSSVSYQTAQQIAEVCQPLNEVLNHPWKF